MKHYFFRCEGLDGFGYPAVTTQSFIHESEEQARREVIHNLSSMFDFFPKKVTLLKVESWEPSPFDYS